jgi:hypothetical protein
VENEDRAWGGLQVSAGLRILLLIGVLTVYGGPRDSGEHWGRPLYCDQYDGVEHVFAWQAEAWVAVEVGLYESGAVRCGDWIMVAFQDGPVLKARALDAGYLARYCVEQWGCEKPIVADVPVYFWPYGEDLSRPGRMWNLSGLQREFERRAGR